MGRGIDRLAACAWMLAVAALISAPAAAADPTPAAAIAELNQWRAQVGEAPVSTQPVAAWDQGCQDHDDYMEQNGLTHFEVMGAPGFTAAGSAAGTDSVLAEEVTGPSPPPDQAQLPAAVWDGAVFHRAALLEPRLANVGFDAQTFANGNQYTSWQCLWLQNANSAYTPPLAIDDSRPTSTLRLYPSPANGEYDVPTTFPAGTESPDPATETGVPAGATLGWLLNVEINGPWSDTGDGGIVFAHDVTATLEADRSGSVVPAVVSECGSMGCADGGGTALGRYLGGGFGIFPTQPLASATVYHVAATGIVTDLQAQKSYPFSMHWCFSTGSTYTPSPDCAASSTGAGVEPLVRVSELTVSVSGHGSVTGAGISCPRTCSRGYAPGARVTLKATPARGYAFAGWSGRCVTHDATCSLTLAGSTLVAASFVPRSRPALSGTFLSLARKPRLGFTVSAGSREPGLKTIRIVPPRGISFTHGSRSLRRAIVIQRHGRRIKFSAIGGGGVRIGLHGARRVRVTIGRPALLIGRALARRLRRHAVGTLVFVIKVTDAAHRTTTLRPRFMFH